MKAKLAQFWNDEAGITALEYGLIAAVVVVALITAVSIYAGGLESMFTALKGRIDTSLGL